MQFLGDLQEGLAFGLGKEEASVEGPTDTDNEERHVEEVGQSLLEVKSRTVPPETQGGSILGPRRQGPRTGLKEGPVFLCLAKPHPLWAPSPRVEASHMQTAPPGGRRGTPTIRKGNPSPTRKSMVHMSAPQTM